MTIGMSGDQTWSLMFHHTTSKLKHALTQSSQDLASGKIGNLAAHNRPALSKVAYLDTVAAQTSAFETVLNDQRMFALDDAIKLYADLDRFVSQIETGQISDSFQKLRLILRKVQSVRTAKA